MHEIRKCSMGLSYSKMTNNWENFWNRAGQIHGHWFMRGWIFGGFLRRNLRWKGRGVDFKQNKKIETSPICEKKLCINDWRVYAKLRTRQGWGKVQGRLGPVLGGEGGGTPPPTCPPSVAGGGPGSTRTLAHGLVLRAWERAVALGVPVANQPFDKQPTNRCENFAKNLSWIRKYV